MSDLKLFNIKDGQVRQLNGKEANIEKSLQTLMESNLEILLGVRFLSSEYSTGQIHGGRIDSLGLDENFCPVIIEYKRSTNDNVISQGLYYLDWLMDHKAEFQLLVQTVFGKDEAEKLEWGSPRLICIAGGFTKFDEYAVKQIDRNIELIQYTYFDDHFLALELVNSVQASTKSGKTNTTKSASNATYKTFSEFFEQCDSEIKDIFYELENYCLGLGDDVQAKTLKFYQAYKRIKNFLCVEVRPQLRHLVLFLKIDPNTINLEEGFSRDVSQIGHFGTGDLELTIKTKGDLRKAEALIRQSYENS